MALLVTDIITALVSLEWVQVKTLAAEPTSLPELTPDL